LSFRFYFYFIFIIPAFSVYLQARQPQVKLGVDVLIESDFSAIKNKNIALLTNYSGRTRKGELTFDILLKTKKCNLIKIFTPEHGLYSKIPAGKDVYNDSIRGIPVYSLYGPNRRPNKFHFAGVDAVVVDLQDIGIRSYTYISTLFKVMDACAEYDVPVIVLDRPNPLSGVIVDGNIVEKGKETFVGIAPIPYVHGMTIGELAHFFNSEGLLYRDKYGVASRCSLTVIKMENWHRWMSWEDTKLKWYATSPNIPTVDAIRGMAVLGFMGELGKFNIGIGTEYPFQFFSFPAFNDNIILNYFGSKEFPGLKLVNCRYKDLKPKKKLRNVDGYKLKFDLDNHFTPYTLGIRFLLSIRAANPLLFTENNFLKQSREMFCKVTGTDKIFNMLMNHADDHDILNEAASGIAEFTDYRTKYLFYE